MNQLSVLKLFKGYIGEKTEKIREDGLKYGLLIPASAADKVCKEAIELYGKDGDAWNQTFHKSWDKVANAPIEQLIYEQLVHYMTTYGFEDLGIFSHESVYLPRERLEIPDLKEDLELITIYPYTEDEVSEKLMVLLTSGIALSKDTISCIADLAQLIDLSRFEEIQNREAKIVLCDALQITPEDPDEFLRYLIYKVSDSTLKIQDPETIGHLKLYSRKELLELFERYLKENEEEKMKKLASVFFRNKKLFLAMKTSSDDFQSPAYILQRGFRKRSNETQEIAQMNHLINRIRKLADEYHQPMPLNKADRLTAVSTQISDEELLRILDAMTAYREIRILNGLSYALHNDPSILYRIRNGKSFATERKILNAEENDVIAKRYELVRKHLINRLKPAFSGKKILLSEGFTYKAPTSEKQFVSNFPCGSSFEVKRDSDVIFGIHWKNLDPKKDVENGRVDLDLHMQNLQVSYGWNSAYRSADTDLYFSGDMTDAPLPKGASELYYIGKDIDSSFMFTVNKYTDNHDNVPFEIVVAKAVPGIKEDQFSENYMIDPNDIILTIPMEMPQNEQMMRIGMVYTFNDTIKVVFDSFSSRKMIVSDHEDPVFANTFRYLTASQETTLNLKELLTQCGALIEELPMKDNETISESDYDLRLNALSKDTIIALFDQK